MRDAATATHVFTLDAVTTNGGEFNVGNRDGTNDYVAATSPMTWVATDTLDVQTDYFF